VQLLLKIFAVFANCVGISSPKGSPRLSSSRTPVQTLPRNRFVPFQSSSSKIKDE